MSRRRSNPAAPLLCTLVLLACCDQKDVRAAPEAESGKAPYPTLGATPTPADYPLPSPDLLPVSRRVHEVIVNSGDHPTRAEDMAPYDLKTERTADATAKMLVIPGGEFVFGSDHEGEGPPKRVRIEPFWMAETEMTWAFYRPFYQNGIARKKDGTLVDPDRIFHPLHRTTKSTPEDGRWAKPGLVDVISQPTPQYHDLFLSGELSSDLAYPAMTMTHHAASKFCEWLSAQTGHFYRLPTEAEWEYACRAGTTTDYHFGGDPTQIEDYAWHAYNSEFTYHPPKRKKPNAWGLYDMHGNVAEWVLDGYDPKFRASLQDGVLNPWNIPLKRYPRIVKGGSWDHDVEELRVTARTPSTNDWGDGDPNIPKSLWYYTDAQHVGFRIVRPLKTPSAEEMHLFWNTDWWEPVRNAEDLE